MEKRRISRKGRKKVAGAPVAGRKVVVEFPEALLEQSERAAAELATDRSKFIRSAVERYLEVLRQARLEQELAAGYVSNARLDKELCREFAHVDAESA